MAELIWPIIAAATACFLIWIVVKSEKAKSHSNTSTHALVSLIATLQMAIDANEINEKTASLIVTNWTHMFSNRDSQPCACGNVHLHCDRDRATLEGITHTTKWCDTESDDDA